MNWWDSNYRTCLPQSSLLSSRFDKTDSTCKIIFDWTSHWACQNLDHHNKWSRSEFSPTCHKFVFWHFNSWRKWFILVIIIWPWHFALRGNTVIFVNIINVSFLTYLKVFCGKWIGFFIRSSSFLEVCDCLTFPYKETLLPLPPYDFLEGVISYSNSSWAHLRSLKMTILKGKVKQRKVTVVWAVNQREAGKRKVMITL